MFFWPGLGWPGRCGGLVDVVRGYPAICGPTEGGCGGLATPRDRPRNPRHWLRGPKKKNTVDIVAESFSGLGRLPPSLSINMDHLRQPRGRARSQAGQRSAAPAQGSAARVQEVLPLRREVFPMHKEVLPVRKEMLSVRKEVVPVRKEVLPVRKEFHSFIHSFRRRLIPPPGQVRVCLSCDICFLPSCTIYSPGFCLL